MPNDMPHYTRAGRPGFRPDVEAIHARTLTIDTHIDIPWPIGPDPWSDGARRVDVAKMRRGGITAGCFAAYIPQGRRTPESELVAFERAVAMLQRIRLIAEADPDRRARIATTADGIEAAHADGVSAIVPVVENGFAIGTDLTRLNRLRELGAVYLTLTHNGHNALADSSNPRADLGDTPSLHGGLSDLGRGAVLELNRLGMLVDVSHVSKPAMLEAVKLSRAPVVATHSSMRALCDVPRNLDDQQIAALAAEGGLVNITAVSSFLKPRARPDAVTVSDFVDHIDHAVARIGVAHVGISSDFDGGGGIAGWHDAGESASVTAELLARGYSEADIAALWGGNFLRLLRSAERVAGR